MNNNEKNIIKKLLIDLGLSDFASIKSFYPQVRDRKDVSVLKCNKSGVILLSRSDHIDFSHYEDAQEFKYWNAEDRKQAVNQVIEDTQRRSNFLRDIIVNKRWLDVGTGSGAILDSLSSFAFLAEAVEPQADAREYLKETGYNVYPSLESIEDNKKYDLITLFHVFEHFLQPLEELERLYKLLEDDGKLIIEVPHANDFLISFLDHEPFKKFTFWSEHLILHTRESLRTFLEKAGFKNISILGCQRYPLANHLHWLSLNKPGGHQKWNFLRSSELDSAYENMLSTIDKTDTLIAIAHK